MTTIRVLTKLTLLPTLIAPVLTMAFAVVLILTKAAKEDPILGNSIQIFIALIAGVAVFATVYVIYMLALKLSFTSSLRPSKKQIFASIIIGLILQAILLATLLNVYVKNFL